ncbi:hypothetical protein O3M35_006551 [Rhynocoris fuscipes]|uniref:Pericentriolar material 1 protein n=1 Tax=Rhynocoris fuscipes TaxID=488301 RepID=A0AAW1DGL4_9HEMI
MSGGRQTGTVPKTKHNSRGRRENAVNHIPNNLDWHEPYPQQRARKESNTCAFHLADAAEESWLDGSAWGGIAPSNRTDDDELRWSNVKSSNITPERGNVESYLGNRVVCQRQQENGGVEERDSSGTSKETMNRGRLKLKMEHSQRKIEELQHQQAALLTFRNKAIQQVKPVQMGEMQQAIPPLILRNKAIQHVKPVQVEMDRMANIEDRLQTMQEYSNFMQAFEREESSTNLEPVADNEQQIRNKLNELLVKKAQCDNILACIESDILPDGAASMSSEEGEASFSRSHGGGEEEINRREGPKQDNREHDPSAAAATFYSKELKLEEVKNKLEQLQTLLTRVERLRESKPPSRVNSEAQPHHHSPEGHHQTKNCPPSADMEKLHTKKIDLEHYLRKVKSCQNPQTMHINEQPSAPVDRWPPNYLNGAATANSVDYSSEEGDVDYDESPVKLCSSSLRPTNSFPKPRHSAPQNVSSAGLSQSKSTSGGTDCEVSRVPDSRCRPRINGDEVMSPPNNTTLALQISQLQVQMEQMQMLCQNLFEKQVPNYPPPQPWLPQTGFMQYMSAGPHWHHQHQLLVNSLNQCCQLIWHQQRELAGLRQALAMLQEESSAYKCGGYGNNLNFDPSLLWAAQTSPQTLNNQVPPGNRANNYWDNFRSYSRQNLLSGRNKSNEGSIAESLPTPRPAAQTDNLRNRKENSSSNNQVGNFHQNQTEGGNNNCGRMRRRYNPGSNLKHDPSTVYSLEQSIYSELDTVIAEAERDPQILLQLLAQLRNLRSQHPSPYEESNPPGFENDCEIMDNAVPFPNLLPRIDEPRNDYEVSKLETTMMEVTRMIERQEVDTFMPQFLEQIVSTVVRIFRLDPLQDLVPRLEASLLKFQGARISLVADELLCVIASLLTPSGPVSSGPSRPSNNTGVIDHNVENAEEEGAVGGLPLLPPHPQHSTPQSVETELAEADQTQHNSTDNVEVFGIDEVGLPNIELDNQELPPREENQEQPFQDP